MNSDEDELAHFYHDRLAAHRRLYSTRETLWEKLHWSGWTISVLVLVAGALFQLYGRETTIDAVLTSAANILLESLVYILPARLIFAVDVWVNPSREMGDTDTHAAKSDAMRRIIGLDRPGGMMASVLNVRSRAMSATGGVFGIKTQSDRPPGLGNIDNSCYQNSILQGLSSLDSMPDFLSKCLQTLDAEQSNNSVAQTLKTLIADLNDFSNYGNTLWTPRVLKSMSSWTQQDAQEYYSKIMDDIEKGVAKAILESRPHQRGLEHDGASEEGAAAITKDNDAVLDMRLSNMKLIRNPVEGLLAQRVACIRCGHSDGISMIPFNCLTLSLGLEKHQHDLYERLDAYTKVEAIEGVECPKCTLLKTQALLKSLLDKMKDRPEEQLADPQKRLEAVETALEEDDFEEKTLHGACKISPKSKVTTTKTKQIVIGRPPQSLVVHMNRSVFDPATFDMIKNSAPVQFPMTLDLGPWCLGSSSRKIRSCVGGEEVWPTGAMASLIAGDVSPSRLSGPIYELRAAVTHYGRHENGHYICYRKYPRAAPSSEADGEVAEKATAVEPETEEEAAEEITVNRATEADEESAEGAPKEDSGKETVEAEPESDKGAAQKDEVKHETEAIAITTTSDMETAAESKDEEAAASESRGGETKSAEDDSQNKPEAEKSATEKTEAHAWWRLSDHNVSQVDEETVMSLSPGVFMLFYECVDPNMVLDAEEDEMKDAETSLPTVTHEQETTSSSAAASGLEAEIDDGATMTSAASTVVTETDADARSDSSATETDNTTVGTAESISLPDSDDEDAAKV